MKKYFVIITILFSIAVSYPAEAAGPKNVAAQGAVLMELETGRILWGKNQDKKLAMASTTKIMTCILALELGNPGDIVTVSRRAAAAPETKMHLSAGEEQRLEDLLYALMLRSYNDAAVAIAEHIGGTVEGFCALMNEKAREIGAADTSFETPNGLDGENHYSTAADMAKITAYALKNQEFLRIINTESVATPVNGGDYKSYGIVNANRFLNEYQGAIGVKTGFTGKAGHCFIGAAERGGMTLITVSLASGWGNTGKEQKWRDTRAIMDYGFANFKKICIITGGEPAASITVENSKEGRVALTYMDDVYAVVDSGELSGVERIINLPKAVEAPVVKGEKVGTAEIYLNGELLGETAIIAGGSIPRHDFMTCIKKAINYWINQDLKFIL